MRWRVVIVPGRSAIALGWEHAGVEYRRRKKPVIGDGAGARPSRARIGGAQSVVTFGVGGGLRRFLIRES